MKIKKIYLGSWFPKTDLHLEEFRDFLASGAVSGQLDHKHALHLRERLEPRQIRFKEDEIKSVEGRAEDFLFRYFEDGLLIVEKEINGLKRDVPKLEEFYHEKLAPCLAFLFSRGAKGLEIIRTPGSSKCVFIVTEGRGEKLIKNIFKSFNEKITTTRIDNDVSVFLGENISVINLLEKTRGLNIERLVEYLVLFNEIKKHLSRLLSTHRYVWDEATKLIAKSENQIKDLPVNNEKLIYFSNHVANIKTRIEQMKLNFNYRESKVTTNLSFFGNLLNFGSINQNFDYIRNLFEMTHTHLQNNISNLAAVYQEKQQVALNRLQMLFLVSVVASFINLGAFPSSELQFFDPSGNLISNAKLLSFDLLTLVQYGSITLLVTFAIYFLWNFSFERIGFKCKKKQE